LQISDASGDAHLLPQGPHDVVGGENREYVEPGPTKGGDLLGLHCHHSPQQPIKLAAGGVLTRGLRLRRALVHCATPSCLRSSATGMALPNSAVPGAKSIARESGRTTGSSPASRTSCDVTWTASRSSPATGIPIGSPCANGLASPSKLR